MSGPITGANNGPINGANKLNNGAAIAPRSIPCPFLPCKFKNIHSVILCKVVD